VNAALRIGAVTAALALAACGGGSSPSPGIGSATTATTANQTVPGTGTTLTLPTVPTLGVSGTLVVPAGTIPAGDMVSAQAQTTPFAGTVALTSVARKAQAGSIATNKTIEYLQVEFSQTSALTAGVNFTFQLPASLVPPAGPVYVDILNSATGTWGSYLGPGSISGANVTFAASTQATTYAQLAPYTYALFEVVGGGPTIAVAPTTLQLAGVGASNAQPLVVSEAGYAGPFGESDTCNGIATLSSAGAVGPQATFTVVPVAAGSCTATFSDSSGQQVAATITVTTLGFSVH
jgi:hypothetical protein